MLLCTLMWNGHMARCEWASCWRCYPLRNVGTVLVVVHFPWHTTLRFLKPPPRAPRLHKLLGVRTSIPFLVLQRPVSLSLLPQAPQCTCSPLVVVGRECLRTWVGVRLPRRPCILSCKWERTRTMCLQLLLNVPRIGIGLVTLLLKHGILLIIHGL